MTSYTDIGVHTLLEHAKEKRDSGDRLVQIHCTKSAGKDWEIIYSFDGLKDGFTHLRVAQAEKPELQSISDFFPSAWLYENEIAELFGLTVTGMSVDFHGKLYNPQKAAPFCGDCAEATHG